MVYKVNPKELILLRGVPSAGKSTRAKQIALSATNCGLSCEICSADNYFMVGDTYYFNKDELGNAHKSCQGKARAAMASGVNFVVIDNTNTRGREAKIYIDMARELGYNVQIIEIPFSHLTAEVLAQRNTHGVPSETIRSMIARYEPLDVFMENCGYGNISPTTEHQS